MIKNLFKNKKQQNAKFNSQQEIDDFVSELGYKYLVPLGFAAYAGRKWVAKSKEGQFFKVVSLPLLAGHFDYSPVLSYSLPFVPNVKTALTKHVISLPASASSVSIWQMPYAPYWSATSDRGHQIAGLPKNDWTIKLRYDKYGTGDFFMPDRKSIEKVFLALHRNRQTYNKTNRTNPQVIINRSLPGLTLPYFNRLFEKMVPPLTKGSNIPTVRILSIGLNEAKIMRGRTRPIIDLRRFAFELENYSLNGDKLGIQTIYVGSQPVDEAKTRPVKITGSSIEDDLVEEYDDLVRQRASEDGQPFVDVRELFGKFTLDMVLAEDGYHPNTLGHHVISEAIEGALWSIGFSRFEREIIAYA